MRTSTKSTLGIVTLGLFIYSYQVGLSAQTGFAVAATAATAETAAPNSSATTVATPEPTPTESATPAASSGTGGASPTTSSKPTASATPKRPSGSSSTSTASVSKTGAAIDTGRDYGFVQVEVVKSGSTITAINMVRAEATNGRAGAFPTLVAAAIAANGTSFGNLTQATYTTVAFKKAVESALAKF